MGRLDNLLYCHFSFRRPKGKEYGLFAVAFYADAEGRKFVYKRTKRLELWENQQFVTAIQSYNYALDVIHDSQGLLLKHGVGHILLVTDNSSLAGWIENPNKRKDYKVYMDRAIKPYIVGGAKEILIEVGLCQTRKAEKSYKFCKEEYAENEFIESVNLNNRGISKIKIEEYKFILDIAEEDIAEPIIEGIKEV